MRVNQTKTPDLTERVAELEARNESLRGIVASLLPHHCGSCCTFDEAGKLMVTEASCRCSEANKRARRAVSGANWTYYP